MTSLSPRASLSLGLCALFVASLAGATAVAGASPAALATQEDVSISVGSASGTPGTNVTVNVNVRATNVSGYELALEYDPSVVAVVAVGGGDFSDPITNVNSDAGRLNATQVSVESVDDPTIATVTFRVVGQPTNETRLAFDPEATTLFDPDSEEIFVDSYSDGAVRVNSTATPTPSGTAATGTPGTGTPGTVTFGVDTDSPTPTATATAGGNGGTSAGDGDGGDGGLVDDSFLLGAGFVLLVLLVGGLGYYLGERNSGY